MFAGSIAYVISALEREPVTVKKRSKKRSSERDYTEGLIQNPTDLGAPTRITFRRKKVFGQRLDGRVNQESRRSYSLDPNYER